jgi:hypothetical protein
MRPDKGDDNLYKRAPFMRNQFNSRGMMMSTSRGEKEGKEIGISKATNLGEVER